MRNNPAGMLLGMELLGYCVLELPVVLVIEDDEQIQSLVEDALIEDALIEGGFETAIAASGEEAVTLLKSRSLIKERPVTYRALVTDINLKGEMNGSEIAKQAREIDPVFPVIYMTARLRSSGDRTACQIASCLKNLLHQRSS